MTSRNRLGYKAWCLAPPNACWLNSGQLEAFALAAFVWLGLCLVGGARAAQAQPAATGAATRDPNGTSGPGGPGAAELKVRQAASLLEIVLDADPATARKCLDAIASRWRGGELSPAATATLRERLEPILAPVMSASANHPLRVEACLLAACWGHAGALEVARQALADRSRDGQTRLAALGALALGRDSELLPLARRVLDDADDALESRSQLLLALGNVDSAEIAQLLLERLPHWEPTLQAQAVELLTQRPAWSLLLLQALDRQAFPPSSLNANQLRQLAASSDAGVRELVAKRFGAIRQDRNPAREFVAAQVLELLQQRPGDSAQGRRVFEKVCGQCHRIHGQGQDVGPDITANGRASLTQLLSNVFDPSLVIGSAYQARTLATEDGRVLTGLLIEDNAQRVVLKTQGGKLESLARDNVAEMLVSPLSLMPEGLEKQLAADELIDLFSFLVLEQPADGPKSSRIPGAESLPR